MRILFTTAWYPNRKVSGDGVFVQKHARAVASLHDVAVLMVQTDSMVKGWHVEIETSLQNIPNHPKASLKEVLVYVPKVQNNIPFVSSILRSIWLIIGNFKGYFYIQNHYWQGQRPEICHVNILTRAAVLPWMLKIIYHIPYIITEHWTRYSEQQASFPHNRLHLRFTKLIIHGASYLCPVSGNLLKDFRRWGLTNRRVACVGNVVETESFSLKQKNNELHLSRKCHFVHVSWMRDDQKNISGILRVLAKLKKISVDWQMTFVGEGNDKEQLMRMSDELGLNDHICFVPALFGIKLAELLSEQDAMVMFSHFENQPVSILEALSCGLPIVSSAVGDVPIMLANNRGITVPSGDELLLLEVLKSFVELRRTSVDLIKQEELRKSRHEYVVKNHSIESIARSFDILYYSAIEHTTQKYVRNIR